MTDQYKELRLAASHVPDVPWAKQAIQLLDEMDAVGAGGVSGKSIMKGRNEDLGDAEIGNALSMFSYPFNGVTKGCFKVGYDYAMKTMESCGPWTGSFEAIPGELVELEGTPGLRQWVELILMADDETKAILRMGLKEEIERMFARSIELVDDGEWMIHKGSRNPAIGREVEVICADGSMHRLPSNQVDWSQKIERRVVRYRMVK